MSNPPPEPASRTSFTRKILNNQVARYLAVGGSLFVLDAGIFIALVQLAHLDVRIAQLISRTVGAAVGFIAHRAFTFRSKGQRQARSAAAQGTGYVAVTILNIVVSPFVVQGFVWLLPFSLLLAKVASEVIIVVETFLLLKWVFRPEDTDEA